jgi:hypothetical protein
LPTNETGKKFFNDGYSKMSDFETDVLDLAENRLEERCRAGLFKTNRVLNRPLL